MGDYRLANDQGEAADGVHIVDANSAASMGLLTKAYRDVYKAETSPDEREPLGDWIDTLSGDNEVCDMVVAILGENLDSDSPILKGITIGYYYKKEGAALLGFTLMKSEYQDTGLHGAMIDVTAEAFQAIADRNGKKIDGVFIATPDPAKIDSSEESAEAMDRVKMFQSMGAKTVNINYVEPPYCAGGEKNTGLLLLAHPGKDNVYPAKEEVKAFLTGIHNGLAEYSDCKPGDNPDYLTAMRQADTNKLYSESSVPIIKKRRLFGL